MKNFRSLVMVLLILLVALPVSVSAQEDAAQMGAWETCATPENLPAEIPVGVAYALSEGAAVYGEGQRNAVELAFEEINESGYLGDSQLVAVYEDTGSTPEGAIAALTKLVEQDEVVTVLGPTLSNQARAADPVATDAGVLVFGTSNTATGLEDELGEFFFRNSLPESKVIPQTITAAVEILGLESVAVMYSDNDAFTVSGYEEFIKALEENGVEVVIEETFATGDVDFSAQLNNIIAEEPDAIVVSALAAEVVPLLEQARSLGYEGPIIGGNGFNSPAIASPESGAGENANGVIVGGAWNVAFQNEFSQSFFDTYQERYETTPDQFAVQAYTGAWIVATAIRCADSADSAAIRDALAALEPFATPLGDFAFDENRVPEHPAVVQIILDGQFLELTEDTAAEVFGE